MEVVNWLQLLTNIVLVLVTSVYVAYTKKILDTSIRQSNLISNPVIGIELKDIFIGKTTSNGRRELVVDIKLINIGNGPAVEVLIDSELILNYSAIDGEKQIPTRFEPSAVSFIRPNEEVSDIAIQQAFGNICVAHVLDDFRECIRLNMLRLQTNPHNEPYKATKLKIYAYYRNNLNQYFESTYESYLYLEEVPNENETAEIQQIFLPRPIFHSSLIKKEEMIDEINIRNKKRSICGW